MARVEAAGRFDPDAWARDNFALFAPNRYGSKALNYFASKPNPAPPSGDNLLGTDMGTDRNGLRLDRTDRDRDARRTSDRDMADSDDPTREDLGR